MNSPLSIIHDKLPIELINTIQKYLRNDIALEAIYYHIDYLYDAQEEHEYTIRNENVCECHRYFNARANRWKTRECERCYLLDYTFHYDLPRYETCIRNNTQLFDILENWREICDRYYNNINKKCVTITN